jgi:hypothetical protein
VFKSREQVRRHAKGSHLTAEFEAIIGLKKDSDRFKLEE